MKADSDFFRLLSSALSSSESPDLLSVIRRTCLQNYVRNSQGVIAHFTAFAQLSPPKQFWIDEAKALEHGDRTLSDPQCVTEWLEGMKNDPRWLEKLSLERTEHELATAAEAQQRQAADRAALQRVLDLTSRGVRFLHFRNGIALFDPRYQKNCDIGKVRLFARDRLRIGSPCEINEADYYNLVHIEPVSLSRTHCDQLLEVFALLARHIRHVPPAPGSSNRKTRDWNCKHHLDSDYDDSCAVCKWLICPSCGRCQPGCSGIETIRAPRGLLTDDLLKQFLDS